MATAITTSFYSAPQQPEDSQRLFAAACTALNYDREPELPLRPSRGPGSALILAKEWSMAELVQGLTDAVEASYEPTWNDGEFTWGMRLDEEHPRGQFNAFLAAAEAAGPGMWSALSAKPLERCPQVVDVDFPTLALSQAEWVDGALLLHLAPLQEDPRTFTSFRIVGAEPRLWEVSGIEGATIDVTAGSVLVRAPLVEGDLHFTPSSY